MNDADASTNGNQAGQDGNKNDSTDRSVSNNDATCNDLSSNDHGCVSDSHSGQVCGDT